jgi:hypothetical protein
VNHNHCDYCKCSEYLHHVVPAFFGCYECRHTLLQYLSAKHPKSDWFYGCFSDYKRKAGYLASACFDLWKFRTAKNKASATRFQNVEITLGSRSGIFAK